MNVFISMPLNGKTFEEIEKRFEEIQKILKARFPDQEIKIIDSLWKKDKRDPVWCLGYNIMAMSTADLVVFDKNWYKTRGCNIEYNVCTRYGFRFMEI